MQRKFSRFISNFSEVMRHYNFHDCILIYQIQNNKKDNHKYFTQYKKVFYLDKEVFYSVHRLLKVKPKYQF